MKLAFVTETFPPEINGVSLTLARLARELAKRGHSVSVFRPWREDLLLASAHEGYRELPMAGLPIPGYPLLRFGFPARRRLRSLWEEARPDVVHVATEGPLGASAISAARDLAIPVTSSFHTNFHVYAKEYWWSFLSRFVLAWLRRVHNRTRLTLVPTRELGEQLGAMGFQNLGVLSRGVDLEAFHPAHRCEILRRKWGASGDAPVVLHVGRLAPEKNYPLLFEIYRRMRLVNPACRFVLVGDGPLRRALEAANPGCVFEGAISSSGIGRYYASADIFVHVSTSETYGNVLTEALASGLAVVGFNYAAAHQFIEHGTSGLLAPLGAHETLAEHAQRLASAPALVSALRSRARATVANQSWERILAGLEADFMRLSGLPR